MRREYAVIVCEGYEGRGYVRVLEVLRGDSMSVEQHMFECLEKYDSETDPYHQVYFFDASGYGDRVSFPEISFHHGRFWECGDDGGDRALRACEFLDGHIPDETYICSFSRQEEYFWDGVEDPDEDWETEFGRYMEFSLL